MKTIKVTIFIGGLSGGGAERVVCNLANYLAGKYYNVTILTMADDEPVERLHPNVLYLSLIKKSERKNKLHDFFLRYLRLKKHLKKIKSDIYIVMLPITTLLLLHFRKLIHAPIIYSERNDPKAYSPFIKLFLKKYIKKANGAVFQTEEAMEWYKSFFHGASIVIPNAISHGFIKQSYIGERNKEIVAVGRMSSKQKNFPLLIKAFADISREFPDYKLVIYGEGKRKNEYIKLAKKLGIIEKVRFPGFVANIDEKIIYSSLFVLSSDYEGIPNALMEAMALGLPCVATDCPCGGPRLLIQNEVNGLLIPVGDRAALANAMRKMLGNKDIASKCAANARTVCSTFAPGKIYGLWENFILDIANGGTKEENVVRKNA